MMCGIERKRKARIQRRIDCQKAPICPYCEAPAVLVDSVEVYSRSYGLIWLCRDCQAWVGIHKNSPLSAPLGRLANAELRKLKIQAHAAFDPLWKSGAMTRPEAYKHLAKLMRIKVKKTHIGFFDADQCRQVIELLTNERET